VKLVVMFLTVFLTACSTKYIGEKNEVYQKIACPIDIETCELSYSQLAVRYSLVKKDNNKYLLDGTALWDNYKMSGAFEKVQKMNLIFIFLKEDTVVHQESVFVRGEEGKKMPFSTEFETAEAFESSLLAEFRGRVTE